MGNSTYTCGRQTDSHDLAIRYTFAKLKIELLDTRVQFKGKNFSLSKTSDPGPFVDTSHSPTTRYAATCSNGIHPAHFMYSGPVFGFIPRASCAASQRARLWVLRQQRRTLPHSKHGDAKPAAWGPGAERRCGLSLVTVAASVSRERYARRGPSDSELRGLRNLHSLHGGNTDLQIAENRISFTEDLVLGKQNLADTVKPGYFQRFAG